MGAGRESYRSHRNPEEVISAQILPSHRTVRYAAVAIAWRAEG